MWQLNSVTEPSKQYRILYDDTNTIKIGRSHTCDIVLGDHIVISRVHSIINVHCNDNNDHLSNDSNITPSYALTIYDESKYGLWINDSKVQSKQHTILQHNDKLAFGTAERNQLVLQWIPITLCKTQCAAYNDVVNHCINLLGCTVHSTLIQNETRYLLLGHSSITSKILNAIIYHIQCITISYLQYITDPQYCTQPLPDPSDYILHSDDIYIDRVWSIAFNPDTIDRSRLFQYVNVLFIDDSMYQSLHSVIHSCGGQSYHIQSIHNCTVNQLTQFLPYIVVSKNSETQHYNSSQSTVVSHDHQSLPNNTSLTIIQHLLSIGGIHSTKDILNQRDVANCIVECSVDSIITHIIGTLSDVSPTNGTGSIDNIQLLNTTHRLLNHYHTDNTPDNQPHTKCSKHNMKSVDWPIQSYYDTDTNSLTSSRSSTTTLHHHQSNTMSTNDHTAINTINSSLISNKSSTSINVKRFKKVWPVGYHPTLNQVTNSNCSTSPYNTT